MTQFMDAGARNWLLKYAHKNYWRVAAWIDFDDLVQEGYAEYCEVLKRYPQAVTPQHKMSLFQLCFRSKIEDLVRQNTKQIDDARSDIVEVFDGEAILELDSFNFQSLMMKAPQIIKDALQLLTDQKAREELAKPFTKHENGRRETLNDRFCKLLGQDPNTINITEQLRMYFS